ncbi:MAG: hypothetical protein ACJA14_001314 [Ilumatobacter sp.]|jgi:hypothetical protein
MASGVVDRVERVALLREPVLAGGLRSEAVLRGGLCDIAAIRSWASAAEARIVSELAAVTPMPEASIADATRSSINTASKTCERSDTLEHASGFDGALVDGSIVTGHVDELTKAAKKLDGHEQRDELFGRCPTLLADAERFTIEQFRITLNRVVKSIQRDDGMQRLEQQRRSTSLSAWTDNDGMWNLRAKFDPLTGVKLSNAIDRALAGLFAEAIPESCPTDPIEKQKHLRALCLDRLIQGKGNAVRAGLAEFVAVIDVDQPNGNSEPTVDWGIPVEVPARVIAELLDAGQATTTAVLVRNGVIVHAPGEMNLGRSARHASSDQRRALRSLYRGCAVPGCHTHFDRCNIHHIIWWSNGGLTDLDNLLPVCVHHHHKIHDTGWTVTLDEQRQLAIILPDRTVMTTGPPNRLTGEPGA